MRAQPAATTCDTTDMVIVHRVFRREFRLLPGFVRAAAPGDRARAARVATHATELITALHHHHQGEDELLWDKLNQRAGLDDDLVRRMQDQHARVGSLMAQIEKELPSWRSSADAAQGDQLADHLAELSQVLDEHLAEEEQRILPIASQHITEQEWAELGERGMASMPKNRLPVFLGHILEECSPAERTLFLTHVPLPGRVLFRWVGQRKWRGEVRELRGASSPAT